VTTPLSSVGRVASLHRYPVKSLAGESLAAVEVDARGLAGDRAWAVRDPDGKLGSGKSSRRFRKMDGLLLLSGAYDGDCRWSRSPTVGESAPMTRPCTTLSPRTSVGRCASSRRARSATSTTGRCTS